MAGEVRNNETANQYELEMDGRLALAAYRLRDGRITFTHTEVPEALEGQGIGSRLKVVPACAFVKHYIDTHAKEQDLLA